MRLDGQNVDRPSENFIKKVERLLAWVGDRVEEFAQDGMRVDLVSALAASLCVSGLVWVISVSSGDELPLVLNIKTTLVTVASYLVAALLLQKFWTGLLRRFIPNWIMVAALGALLFLIAEVIPIKISFWSNSETRMMSLNMSQFIEEELKGARLFYIFLCGITLPVTATVYYAGSIVKAIRCWHNNTEKPPSILGNQ